MANNKPKEKVTFHYIKSNGFRAVHADGVWGGVTPRGYITMSFFSERAPIPQSLTHEVVQNKLGVETDIESKTGIVREVEIEVLVDLPMAKSLIPWLQEKINFLENIKQDQSQEGVV